jgi:alpha-beta hydrolase superfamily lysophospholipase
MQVDLDPVALNMPKPQILQQAMAWVRHSSDEVLAGNAHLDADTVFVFAHSMGAAVVRTLAWHALVQRMVCARIEVSMQGAIMEAGASTR